MVGPEGLIIRFVLIVVVLAVCWYFLRDKGEY